HARLQRAMYPSVSKSGSPLPRGRTENVAPSVFIVQLSKSVGSGRRQKEISPLFRLRARGSPSFLSSHLPHFEGVGAPTRRTAWIARPEMARLAAGPWA